MERFDRLIALQVAALRAKDPDARVFGIHLEESVPSLTSIRVNGSELPVFRCGSVLELRERLMHVGPESSPIVIVTPLPEGELGADVRARLAKRRLQPIEPWQLVRLRFAARRVDPRLVENHPWIVDALLDSDPMTPFPNALGGVLDAELVWRFLFGERLGVLMGNRDPESLLEWSLDSEKLARFAALPEAWREGFGRAVAESAGRISQAIFETVLLGNGEHVLSIGLAARVLFDEEVRNDPVAVSAATRLEPIVGSPLPADVGLGWADAAEALVGRLARGGESRVRPLLERADAVIEELRAPQLAYRSRHLLLGFEQRLDRCAPVLGNDHVPIEAVREHVFATLAPGRVERLEMAARLARWIASRSQEPSGSFADAARRYLREGGHVDWARIRLCDGDPRPELSRAYGELVKASVEARETENRRFGELLAGWTSSGSTGTEDVIPVETVLDRVVVPLASQSGVLLVVIDGMGVAVFRELIDDLTSRGWIERLPTNRPERPVVVAAIPSVTEVSRTSLLCGSLKRGDARIEKQGFASHSGLQKVSKEAPSLFHRWELRDEGGVGLSSEVLRRIESPEARVVGAVINAVDDHLLKGDQVRVTWSANAIRPLEELLDAARAAERVVVLVSDHGHVLERDTEFRPQGENERWREAEGTADADEVLLEGPRVVHPAKKLIAPWTERVRYATKKNGYHGGASPQEMIIPLSVLAAPDVHLKGWREAPSDYPQWWFEPGTRPDVQAAVVAETPDRDKRKSLPLPFESGPVTPPSRVDPDWLGKLFASSTFAAQRALTKRANISDDILRAALLALDARGAMTRTALARHLGLPEMRMGGFLSFLRRLLNVDGYDVIAVDESSDTVRLNQRLLEAQFSL